MTLESLRKKRAEQIQRRQDIRAERKRKLLAAMKAEKTSPLKQNECHNHHHEKHQEEGSETMGENHNGHTPVVGDFCNKVIDACFVVELPYNVCADSIYVKEDSVEFNAEKLACCEVEEQVAAYIDNCKHPIYVPVRGLQISGPLAIYFKYKAKADFCPQNGGLGITPPYDKKEFTAQTVLCLHEVVCMTGNDFVYCPEDLCDLIDEIKIKDKDVLECGDKKYVKFKVKIKLNCEAGLPTPE